MRTGLISVFVWGLLLGVLSVCAEGGTYSGGTGEPNNPYRIATANDLNDIGNHVEDFNKCFVVVDDVNMMGYLFAKAIIAPDANSSISAFQGTEFTGIFDGNDHTISNLTIDTAGARDDFLGLFGYIGEGGEVKRLGIEGGTLSGGDHSDYVGGLCGKNYKGTVTNCYVLGTVFGGVLSECIGGLCGINDGTIRNCYSTGAVSSGRAYLGGLCGRNNDGTITHCYSRGSVANSYYYSGGLCGLNDGTITKCYATGAVSGAAGGSRLGGFCGYNGNGTIINCYGTGAVSGGVDSFRVGGLCGENRGVIGDCYSTGSVSGVECVGGLVGYGDSGPYEPSFWDSDVNPDVNGIGNANEPNVVGKATAELQMESTFTDAGWDFVEVWDIGEDQTYPFLRVYPAGDVDHNGEVNFGDVGILCGRWLEER